MALTYNRSLEGTREAHSFKWIIPKFLDVLQTGNVKEYRTVAMDDQRPQLKLQIWGHNNDLIEFYYFSPISSFMSGSLVLDAKKIDNNVGNYNFTAITANKWYYLTTLYKKDISNKQGDYLGSDEDLRLNFDFKVFKMETKQGVNENKLCYNLQNTLDNGMFSDVVIKSNSGKEYKVHKVMLASRSPVLKAYFEHGTTECTTHTVESNFESEVLEQVLSYIYSDNVPKIKEFPKKLLAAANYYELNGLKNLCEDVLAEELGVENAMEMLELANSHQAAALKQSATECIKNLKYIYEHLDCTDWNFQYCTYD